ncbi:MAG: HNH endonuclease signature motif containing protein [Gemmatimonadetes bacterium]|nr:HNH endonuclease signature motif containing protein [Gemmatimonadota bacterium]
MAGSGRRRPRRGGPGRGATAETSQPTGRAAYQDTRAWLLRTHGHVCAYCGLDFPARSLTLDHVTPRRGQSAYDRRDNLVLACTRCNTAKSDKSFLAWVLGARTRATHLYRYGQHLSEGILEVLRPMVDEDVVIPSKPKPKPKKRPPKQKFAPHPDDGTSPYLD